MPQSRLTFEDTGLVAPETADIREDVGGEFIRVFEREGDPPLNIEPTTPAGQLVDVVVGEIEAVNAGFLYLASQFDPATADGRFQDALAYIYFLNRKLSEPSIVTCQVTGLPGTVIPYGAVVQAQNGYQLICTASVTIGDTGQAETTFRSTQYGPIDFAPHSVTQIITITPGWDSVDNETAGVAGRIIETRGEFETRRAASVAANAHGSTSAIYGALANIDGVIDLQVLENVGPFPVVKYGVTVPGHGITVCIYGGEDADIAEWIYRKKDNGADTGGNTDIVYADADYHNAVYNYKIMRPEPVNFWINVVLGAGDPPSGAVVAALKQALFNDFYGLNVNPRVGLATNVYASRFYCPAVNVPGVVSINRIEVALGDTQPTEFFDAVMIRGDQEPVLSMANILVSQATTI